jgi:hypothetical protein
MIMEIMNATDPRFRAYGRIIKEYDCAQLMAEMEKVAPPAGCTYIASVPELEALPIFRELTEKFYGFMPIQMGYCCGHGQKLKAVATACCLGVLLEVGSCIKILHCSAYVDGVNLRVYAVNLGDAGTARLHTSPRLLHAVAEGSEGTHTCNYDSTVFHDVCVLETLTDSLSKVKHKTSKIIKKIIII